MTVQHMLSITALAALTFTIGAHAQPSSCAATHLDLPASFAQASIIVSTRAISGRDTMALTFSERRARMGLPFLHEYESQPITITPAMRLVGSMSTVLSAQKPPPLKVPGAPTCDGSVQLAVYVYMYDAATDSVVHVPVPFPYAKCSTTRPLDTTMGGAWQVDLSPYIGRKVYLRLSVLADWQLQEARRLRIVDGDCSGDQTASGVPGGDPGNMKWK